VHKKRSVDGSESAYGWTSARVVSRISGAGGKFRFATFDNGVLQRGVQYVPYRLPNARNSLRSAGCGIKCWSCACPPGM
jgi:hypothetical protein